MAAIRTELEAALLERERVAEAKLTLISPMGELKRRHLCWLAEAPGVRLKLRRMDDEAEAARLCELSDAMPPAFVRPLGHHGAVVFEPWIEGVEPGGDGDWIEQAGAELGRLHEAAEGTVDTSQWAATAAADVAVLADLGAIDADEAATLAGLVADEDPGSARAALLHRDFCPENFLIDREGALVIFDNEWLLHGPAGVDLGRTFHRWPMPAAQRERFLAGYTAVAGEPSDPGYWALVADLFGARVLCQRALNEELAPLLAALRSRL